MQNNCVLTRPLLRLQKDTAPPGNAPPRQNCDVFALALCKRQLPCSLPQGELVLCSCFFHLCCSAGGKVFLLGNA